MTDFYVNNTIAKRSFICMTTQMHEQMIRNFETFCEDPKNAVALALAMRDKHCSSNGHMKKSYYNCTYWLLVRLHLQLSRGKCDDCSKPLPVGEQFEVHHLSYDIVCAEWFNQDKLLLLCPDCHRKRHDL